MSPSFGEKTAICRSRRGRGLIIQNRIYGRPHQRNDSHSFRVKIPADSFGQKPDSKVSGNHFADEIPLRGFINDIRLKSRLQVTNNVVTNFTANGLLALGASPVMAYAREEAADMAKIAGALVLNIGTLSRESVESMIIAGKSANEHGVPVIFDPVGAGATPFRTESAQAIMREVKVSAVRGNAAEIANTLGEDWLIKGL